ncbi:MAG: hypothetical protein KA715_06635 [Xanthomonadaceae bacterium]|nr:hypothetical protein [Xanthomonadaceae bacterium]
MKLYPIVLISLISCASPTRTNYTESPHDPDHVTKAYATSGNSPANEGDATIAVGSALINTALYSGNKANNKKQIADRTITGHCTIKSDKLADIPCSSILLILKKKDGSSSVQVRTAEDGSFSFVANKGEEYLIDTQSKQFEVKMEPAKPAKAEASVILKLRQR